MKLRDIDVPRLLVVPRDNVIGRLFVPAMSAAHEIRCMAGFFDSASLGQLAPGLAAFINESIGTLRLLISPKISIEDQSAIERALSDPEKVLREAAIKLFQDGVVSASAVTRHAVDCLSYLLAAKRLELRFVLVRRGMFHPKVWLFADSSCTIVAHGSSNPTTPGLIHNWETIAVEKSWLDAHTCEIFGQLFADVWNGTDRNSLTVLAAQGLEILKRFTNDRCPTIEDFWSAWDEDARKGLVAPRSKSQVGSVTSKPSGRLTIPLGLRWQDGEFSHQGDAVLAWERADRRGILAIATGGGKTVAALIGAARLQDQRSPLLVVISAPYRPLLSQWSREVAKFGVADVPLDGLSVGEREARLQQAIMSLQFRQSEVEVVIVSNRLLNQGDFREFLRSVPTEVGTLLIADEVHNLGAPSFTSDPPESFQYRLGLSATPIRQYDDEGTDALFGFFGQVIYEFDLGQAIRAGCLTRYNYHLHPVPLSVEETEEWQELTEKIRRLGFQGDNDSETLSDDIKLLLFRRRAILENAAGKLDSLRALLSASDRRRIRHMLIYTSAKHLKTGPTQISEVNTMLNGLSVLSHELTYNETGSGVAEEMLEAFSRGDYQVLTCMKVLDEGVDIPQTETAIIMASSTVKREWVQRRGRVLRRFPGKTIAEIHDFLVVPPDPQSQAGRAIIRQELERGREFASLAENSGAADGPWSVMAEFEPRF